MDVGVSRFMSSWLLSHFLCIFYLVRQGLLTVAKSGRKQRKEKKNRAKKIRGSKKHKSSTGKK